MELSRWCIRDVTVIEVRRVWWAEAWLKIELFGNGRKYVKKQAAAFACLTFVLSCIVYESKISAWK